MSTITANGETALRNLFANLQSRLKHAHEQCLGDPAKYQAQTLLVQCLSLLDLFKRTEKVLTPGYGLATKDDGQSKRLQELLKTAGSQLSSCEVLLGLAQDSRRDALSNNHFDNLFQTIKRLQYLSDPVQDEDVANLPNQSPSLSHTSDLPTVSPPPLASSASPVSSAQASPASNNELVVEIKQEPLNEAMEIDFYNSSHLRRDSHLGSQTTQSPPQPTLPPISTLDLHPRATTHRLPEIPRSFTPLLPLESSPPRHPLSSPLTPSNANLPNESPSTGEASTQREEWDMQMQSNPMVYQALGTSIHPPMVLEPNPHSRGVESFNPLDRNWRPGPS